MRIRNKLLLAIAVPVGLLVLQIVLVNVFVRELQRAVTFIGETHATIENAFRATDLVSQLREEVKRLPSSFVSDRVAGDEGIEVFHSGFQQLKERVASVSDAEGVRQRAQSSMAALDAALEIFLDEVSQTDQVLAAGSIDMDTLLERAIFMDAALVDLAGALGALTRELRTELQLAVDREREIHNRPVIAGLAIGGLSVVMLLVFTWLVVDRYFVARLTRLCKSMLAIASGDLRAQLPEPIGNDEVAEMARALGVFRDVAVEVEENNLREVAKARQRLIDAIESIAEGFSLYDEKDRLVLCNRRYQDLMRPDTNEALKPGVAFQEVIRAAAQSGKLTDATGREEEWVAERLKRHRNPEGPFVLRYRPDRWIEVTEYKTSDSGTVAVYADITRQKQSEYALMEAKRRADEANEQVTRKNATLEGLSAQLSKYLSPQLYSSIFSGEQTVEIASKRKKLSVLFSDIVGFTETTESLESEELTNLLNHYLTEMSEVAQKNGATIDKYIGDEIMMFFGDPESHGVKQDAIACVRTAYEMQMRARDLEQMWKGLGIERPFKMRVGINTGFCTVGNFGSDDRMDYTIIGNEVNLAARLQTLAEPGEIVIAHETYALVRDEFAASEAEPRKVKGFDKPVRNYVVDLSRSAGDGSDQTYVVERNGLRLTLDLAELPVSDRAKAVSDLQTALDFLKTTE